jgi:hypothetical protein
MKNGRTDEILSSISGAVDFSVPKQDKVVDETSWNPRNYE